MQTCVSARINYLNSDYASVCINICFEDDHANMRQCKDEIYNVTFWFIFELKLVVKKIMRICVSARMKYITLYSGSF